MRRIAWLAALALACSFAPAFAQTPEGDAIQPAQADEEQCSAEDGNCEQLDPEGQSAQPTPQASPPSPQPGVWGKWDEPVQTVPGMPLACRQRYVCSPPVAMVSGPSSVKTTAPEWVNGACSAGDGPVDECNVCLSNPPETPCEWWLE